MPTFYEKKSDKSSALRNKIEDLEKELKEVRFNNNLKLLYSNLSCLLTPCMGMGVQMSLDLHGHSQKEVFLSGRISALKMQLKIEEQKAATEMLELPRNITDVPSSYVNKSS